MEPGSPAPLPALQLWDDRTPPRSGPENMAMDEALLMASGDLPVLRTYRWASPTLSFGYFLKHSDARRALLPGETLQRRWTGGGLVHHAGATTWSLTVPHGHPFAQIRPAASYAQLHQAVAQLLQQAGREGISVVPPYAPAPAGGLCAEAPAPGDVIWKGRKLAGAGQRRTRLGLLHQGVIFLPETDLPSDYPAKLAATLGKVVHAFAGLSSSFVDSGRYAEAGWNERL